MRQIWSSVQFHKHSNEQRSQHLMHAYEDGVIQVPHSRTIAAVSQSTVEVKEATVACLCLLYLSYLLCYRNVWHDCTVLPRLHPDQVSHFSIIQSPVLLLATITVQCGSKDTETEQTISVRQQSLRESKSETRCLVKSSAQFKCVVALSYFLNKFSLLS